MQVVSLLTLLLLLWTPPGHSESCQGNGFEDGCSDVYGDTGSPQGFVELVGSGSTTEVCEGGRLAVTQDCDYRTPLYVGVSFNRSQIDADNPKHNRPSWKNSPYLDSEYQTIKNDYYSLSKRTLCYEMQKDNQLYHDFFWTGRSGPCDASNEKTLTVSHGHLVADSYIRLPGEDKRATYHSTNCVPQFQPFNGGAWSRGEQQLIRWSQEHCGSDMPAELREAAKFYTIVGVVPSTSVNRTFDETDVTPRWFGRWGFGDGEFPATVSFTGDEAPDASSYRAVVSAAMFTVACCVAKDSNNNLAWVRHTAFARHAKPYSKEAVVQTDSADLMQRMLPELKTEGVNFFPKIAACSDISNYVSLYDHAD